jgi:hypothetical protein
MIFRLEFLAIIGLLLPIVGYGAVLNVSDKTGSTEKQTITITAVRITINGYELAIRGSTRDCYIPKAVAEAAGCSGRTVPSVAGLATGLA